MKQAARTDARKMRFGRGKSGRLGLSAPKPLALRCEPVPRALTDTSGFASSSTAAHATLRAPKRAGRAGGRASDRTRPTGRAHDADNQRVYLTGLSIEHKQLDEVRARFAPNADPTDGAHAIRNAADPSLYRANCQRGRALTHVRTAPRRRYPPELLNTRGYLIGTEADETHDRLSWLYRNGLIDRTFVSGSAPDWRAAAEDIGREELRARVQPEVTSDMTPAELALERAADKLLMRHETS